MKRRIGVPRVHRVVVGLLADDLADMAYRPRAGNGHPRYVAPMTYFARLLYRSRRGKQWVMRDALVEVRRVTGYCYRHGRFPEERRASHPRFVNAASSAYRKIDYVIRTGEFNVNPYDRYGGPMRRARWPA